MPVQLHSSFLVDNTDPKGVTNLKGAYIKDVFMHTSTTPSAENPNPVAGTIILQSHSAFNRLYIADFSIISPLGTPLAIDATSAALTVGVAYTITTVGDASAAQWLALGLPPGILPATGVAFIALVTGNGAASTARIAPTAAAGSGVASMEIVGSADSMLGANKLASGQLFASEIILQCRDYAGALVAPAAGSKIELRLLLSNSSVLVGGE